MFQRKQFGKPDTCVVEFLFRPKNHFNKNQRSFQRWFLCWIKLVKWTFTGVAIKSRCVLKVTLNVIHNIVFAVSLALGNFSHYNTSYKNDFHASWLYQSDWTKHIFFSKYVVADWILRHIVVEHIPESFLWKSMV